MAKRELYQISGHWDHYTDGMFVIGDKDDPNAEVLALRPMTCPFQYYVYMNRMRSYRDLPMRMGETSTLFRNEDSGEIDVYKRQVFLGSELLRSTWAPRFAISLKKDARRR